MAKRDESRWFTFRYCTEKSGCIHKEVMGDASYELSAKQFLEEWLHDPFTGDENEINVVCDKVNVVATKKSTGEVVSACLYDMNTKEIIEC